MPRRYRRKARERKEKLDSVGYDHISLPFLGTKYEIISRKASQVSELSQAPVSNGTSHHQPAAIGLDVFDGRVSRYIDADVSNSVARDKDEPKPISFQTILDETMEKVAGEEVKVDQVKVKVDQVKVSPPKAESEEWSSEPDSGGESASSLAVPALALIPPSPKERPKSDNFEAPPWIPIKVS